MDLTAVVATFPPFDGVDEWTVLPFFWTPEERLPEIERICRMPFALWRERGLITVTPGNGIDLRRVLDLIRWLAEVVDVRELCYDKLNFRTESMNLAEEGLTTTEVPQDFMRLSYATKFLLGLYPDNKLRHGNHPVLNWMAACLQLKYDDKDNCQPAKPRRLKSSKRIDGIQAIVTALSQACVAEGDSSAVSVRGPVAA
jgi:phage terminase large subunit-like protein